MSEQPDPPPIFQLATGYWASATLLAANELGVFRALAAQPLAARALAAQLQTEPRATEMLLLACAGLGLLTRDAEQFALTPTAAAFLVPDRPGYLGSALKWSADQYAAWGKLARAVRDGRAVVDPTRQLGGDAEQTRAFVVGMHERAQGIARGVVPFIDLSGCATLLDVGGGPGTYAVLLTQQYPGLQATVLDLAGIVKVAEELIQAAGAADRVQPLAGDATHGDYGAATYDAVLFSGVLHQMNPPTIQRMLAGARRALKPGGKVFVSDVMLVGDGPATAFAALFSLQMLLTTAAGAVFRAVDCAAWLTAAGFVEVAARPLPPPLPYQLVSGVAPA